MTGMTSIAKAFVEARRSASILDDYPGTIPATLEDGYHIQDIAIDLDGRAVRGWKVGKVPVDLVEQFGAERLAGPIFEDAIKNAGDDIALMPVLKGFAAVEAEIMLRIGLDGADIDHIDDAVAAVDCVRFGIEIASSPYRAINEHGPAVTVSDFGNNYGLLLGPEIVPGASPASLHGEVVLHIDGQQAGRGDATDMLDGPFGSVCFLSQLLAKRGRSLRKGDWISTGAITGVHRAAEGQMVRASLKGGYSLGCELIAAKRQVAR